MAGDAERRRGRTCTGIIDLVDAEIREIIDGQAGLTLSPTGSAPACPTQSYVGSTDEKSSHIGQTAEIVVIAPAKPAHRKRKPVAKPAA
ncbi:MAG: hypothetical protein U5N55_08535 [Cypionkella sp.]|nr:hypothetical protein [Cypionkella sp.]